MTVDLSVIVVVYDMPRQAMNTLTSLATAYQRGMEKVAYEVIVVENQSANCLSRQQVESLGPQFRYHLREEPGVSPAPAVNHGFSLAQGSMIGLLIDGARMLTPGVLNLVMAARLLSANPLVAVPGYHVGSEIQHQLTAHRLDEEQGYLAEIEWQQDGYRLFEQACFSEGNERGYLQPMLESNAIFCTRESLSAIGGADERFDQLGGGSLNLHLYRQLGLIPHNRLIVLPGEGSFHQYHGGVTTSAVEERDERLRIFNDRLNSFWNGQYKALSREPLLLGKVGTAAQPFLQFSCTAGDKRYARLKRGNVDPWPDDRIAEANTAEG